MPALTAPARAPQAPDPSSSAVRDGSGKRKMGTVTVKIWSVSWRGGRPRFNPGPKLRRLGYKGEDLRHHETGPWYSLDEAVAWADARRAEAAGRRARRAQGQRLAPLRRPGVVTVDDVFQRWFASPKFTGGIRRGKRNQTGVAASTAASYRNMASNLTRFDPELAQSAAAAVTPAIAQAVFERLWEQRGLAMARGIVAVASSCWRWARKQPGMGVTVNVWRDVDKPVLAPRLRVAEPDELLALVAANDAIGQFEMADSAMLGVWSGQRQGDRLALQLVGRDDRGRLKLRQGKTGAVIQVPAAPQLEARLAAARERRAARKIVSTFLLANESLTRKPGGRFTKKSYNTMWRRGRDAAVHGVILLDGVPTIAKDLRGDNYHWLVRPTPSLADFKDQDLRDTAVTWLARAGCTLPEICSITGHSEAAATSIMKHYLARHPEMADAAIAKLVTWAEQQGMSA